MKRVWMTLAGAAALAAGGCAAPDVNKGGVSGGGESLGIEQRDIVKMTDQMVGEMLKSPRIGAAATPPRIILDAAFFVNDGQQPINKNLIIDRLRVELMRAAQGRITFVAVEPNAKTSGGSAPVVEADCRFRGSIKALSTVNPGSGKRTRYHQITFELVDLYSREIIWSGMYEFDKAVVEDEVYR